jgi:organic radical activating enzyme
LNLSSATQVGSFPVKLLKQWTRGDPPLHLQLWPTYRCDANCEWCVCRDSRKNGAQLSADEACDIVRRFASLGAKAITISGGGEPTMLPGIVDVMRTANACHVAVGLITNGIRLAADGALAAAVDDFASWVRVSVTEYKRPEIQALKLEKIAGRVKRARLGVKFVVAEYGPALLNMANAVIDVAERTRIDHVLFAYDDTNPDVSDAGPVPLRTDISYSSKAIFRCSVSGRGASICSIGMVRPLVAPDGYVYPCCMVHVARGLTALPESARICKWHQYKQRHATADGSECKRCFFGGYNDLLSRVETRVEDEVFV